MAVLAIELTWPDVMASEASRHEPWTLAAHWEQVIAETVQGFGGVVLQRTPSLQLVAFGLPQTLDQLPQRAVQAALALRRRVADVRAADAREPCPAVRQAVHWGQVLVEVRARDPTARLLGQAAPGEILMSAPMGGLVERWCELQGCEGPVGAEPSGRLEAYRVVGLRPSPASPARRGAPHRHRFVGRDREMASLQARLAQLANGHGHVAGIAGEPGIGKSRLLHEFRRSLTGRRLTYWPGRCLAYGNATPYLPVLDLLRQHCGVTDADSPAAITTKVHRSLQEVGMVPEACAPYLLPLLGVEAGTAPLAMLSPQTLRARTLETLVQLSVNRSRVQPLVLEVEDVHWIDASSEAWLAALVERVVGVPLLVLVTYRPGYRPRWLEKSYATQLALRRLAPRDSLQVVHTVLHPEPVPEALTQAILAKADGNPFFLEELARTVVEQGDRRLPLAVPETIHAVLAARIDRLPPVEERLLQAAAVLGKDITLPLLQALTARPEEELRRSLRHLQAAEFLYEMSTGPDAVYAFKHVLTQEVAYQSVLPRTRAQYHQQLARTVEERFPAIATLQPEWLPHHYTAAGLRAQALPYWQQAGQRAIERAAHGEAIRHLTHGLEGVKTLPETPERTLQELGLQTALGLSLTATKGYTAVEVEQAYARAHELCQQVEDTPQLFPLLWSLLSFYLLRGHFQMVLELGQQLLALAQRLQDTAFLMEAHAGLGIISFYRGELVLAHEHLEQSLALYDPQQHRSYAFLYGQDPGLACLSYAAWTLWLLGYPDQARQRRHEVVALMQELSHPFRLAYLLTLAAMLHSCLREEHTLRERAETVIAVYRIRVSALAGGGHHPAGVGADGAGAARGRDCADVSGPGHLAGRGGRGGTALLAGPAGGGLRESRAG